MLEWISKMLKVSLDDIILYDDFNKIAVIQRKVDDDYFTYVLVRMVSLVSVKLNDLGYEPSKKEIKKYFPIVVKASEDKDYISELFDIMVNKG